MKKKLTETAALGLFVDGTPVKFIAKHGKWMEVMDTASGQKGFIIHKYGGIPTLRNGEKINLQI